jgi:AraC family transcriptional regulator
MRDNPFPCAVDRSGRPVDMTELLWSSADTPWSGFRFAMHRWRERGRVSEIICGTNAKISMCVAGVTKLERLVGKIEERCIVARGAIRLAGRGDEVDSMSWSGSMDVIEVELDIARTGRATKSDFFPAELRPSQQLIQDPQATSFLTAMMAEVRDGCPGGKIYGQSISMALAGYIRGRYNVEERNQKPSTAKLSAAQLRSVCDYVQSHLSNDVSLHELADVLDLSSRHFCQLFKNTLGVTPHQYVLCERIRESLSLLSSGRMSVSEVAQAMGFADQSHFAGVFRKVTKITPKRYQLEHRNFSR